MPGRPAAPPAALWDPGTAPGQGKDTTAGDNGPVSPTAPALDVLRPRLPSPLRPVEDERFTRRGVRLLLKRDDLIHPELPGNKWRKLAPNLTAAAEQGQTTLLTFGGAYSNHLRATAAAGRLLGLSTIGVVRGEELAGRPLNPSLARCTADGMRLFFLDRGTYRRKTGEDVIAELRKRFGDFYLVPEGGSNVPAVHGCAELGRELRGAADVVGVACGTGGTMAGLAAGLAPEQQAIGFPVLKGAFLDRKVQRLQREAFGGHTGRWRLDDRFHFGGYAKVPPGLRAFAGDFGQRHGLAVERLYVAKMLYGLTTLAEEGAFPRGTTVAAVVTGPRSAEAP